MARIEIINKNGDIVGSIGKGSNGKSAYQIAVDNGFQGTEQDWLDSLKCADGVGVPIGGTTGQVLAKKSDENYDTEWVDKGIDEVDLASDKVVGVLPVEKGGTGGTIWPSNPNLIINGDFRNPVNRNGKMEYIVAGGTVHTIDLHTLVNRGKIALTDEGIVFQPTTSSTAFNSQIPGLLPGEYTFSVLTKEYGLIFASGKVNTDGDSITASEPVNGLRFSLQYKSSANSVLNIYIHSLEVSVTLMAAKLELGSVQTLAHQDANGNWVLNDPPNYDLQYLLCSQYSPSTGEFVGSQHSNPNLLINSYYADKDYIVNQRGQLAYNGGYSIDMWRIGHSNVSLTIFDNSIQLSASGTDNSSNVFSQVINMTQPKGQVCTLSALVKGDGVLRNLGGGNISFSTTDFELIQLPITASNITQIQIRLSSGQSAEIKAMKLELGHVQTLAHQDADGNWVLNDPPPNKALELAKCQRYQFVVGGGNNKMIGRFDVGTSSNKIFTRISIPLPTTMRVATPAIKILGSGGLRLVQIASQIKAVGSIPSTAVPESVFLSGNHCYFTYETPELTPGLFGIVDTSNVSTFLCIDNNL